MTTISKRTKVISALALAIVEVAVLFGLVFTSQAKASDTESSEELYVVSDLTFYEPAETKTVAAKPKKSHEAAEAYDMAPMPENVIDTGDAGDEALVAQGSYEDAEATDTETSDAAVGYIDANVSQNWHSSAEFQFDGRYEDASGFSYTWYPESALPGGGLDIPGRHVNDDGYICDGDGNICIASDNFDPGTVISIPFGDGVGVVYDSGSGRGNLDIYVSW